jgi:hypothetical protein
MFTELTEELLDLKTTVRGYGAAVYAVEEEPGSCSGSCSCNSSIILCCSYVCW